MPSTLKTIQFSGRQKQIPQEKVISLLFPEGELRAEYVNGSETNLCGGIWSYDFVINTIDLPVGLLIGEVLSCNLESPYWSYLSPIPTPTCDWDTVVCFEGSGMPEAEKLGEYDMLGMALTDTDCNEDCLAIMDPDVFKKAITFLSNTTPTAPPTPSVTPPLTPPPTPSPTPPPSTPPPTNTPPPPTTTPPGTPTHTPPETPFLTPLPTPTLTDPALTPTPSPTVPVTPEMTPTDTPPVTLTPVTSPTPSPPSSTPPPTPTPTPGMGACCIINVETGLFDCVDCTEQECIDLGGNTWASGMTCFEVNNCNPLPTPTPTPPPSTPPPSTPPPSTPPSSPPSSP